MEVIILWVYYTIHFGFSGGIMGEVGIPMGTNCVPLIADLFLFCYERILCLTFTNRNGTTLYTYLTTPLDILTIYSPSITLNLRNIFLIYIQPTELQLNKANTSDKETSNIKVIGSDVHTSVYDKHDDFGFPIVNFPWFSGDVPRFPSYGVYISQFGIFARSCTSVSNFNSKNLQVKEKYRRMFETQKQVQQRLVSTLQHMQVPKRDRTRCLEE